MTDDQVAACRLLGFDSGTFARHVLVLVHLRLNEGGLQAMNGYTVQILTRHGFQTEYVWADSMAEAIAEIRSEFGYELVSVAIRKTAYKEWNYSVSVSGQCLTHSH